MVNKKNTLKDHPTVWFLAAMAAAFGIGWSAHIAVQSASNLIAVPAEKAKLIDVYDTVVKERDRLLEQQAQIYEVGDQRARILKLEAEREQLKEQLLKNRPIGPAYITNISVHPKSPAVLKIGDKITVEFDYVIPKGQQASIYAHPSGVVIDTDDRSTPGYAYGTSAQLLLAGNGRTKRDFSMNSPGKLIGIAITIDSGKDTLYKVELPVSYVIR